MSAQMARGGIRSILQAAQVTMLEELGKIEDRLNQVRADMQEGLEHARQNQMAVFDLVAPAILEPPVTNDIEVDPQPSLSTAEKINRAMATRAERPHVVSPPLDAANQYVPADRATPQVVTLASHDEAQDAMLNLVRHALVEIDVVLDEARKHISAAEARESTLRTVLMIALGLLVGTLLGGVVTGLLLWMK